jgi:hypothetical protein
MREVQSRASAPHWVNFYVIRDDPPLNVPGKTGKHRPRVDIEIERNNRGPKPCLRFEAKRLGKSHTVAKYLGPCGLGCFTSGKYPLTHPEAGMLGYVQNDDEAAWAAKLEAVLKQSSVLWESYSITPQLVHTYRSKHYSPALKIDIDIIHTLLRFCP